MGFPGPSAMVFLLSISADNDLGKSVSGLRCCSADRAAAEF